MLGVWLDRIALADLVVGESICWLGFGAPIYAPAAGTIVAAVDDRPDDRQFDTAALKTHCSPYL